jgi:hypothetical protein
MFVTLFYNGDAYINASSLVPPQTPENVTPLVEKYINEEFAKLGSKSKMTIEYFHGGKPWLADYKHWSFEAAHRATEVRAISCTSGEQ